jgi:hypothetical protein
MLLLSTTAYTSDTQPSAPLDTTAAFSRLKSLVGEWDAEAPMGKMHLSYTLIAGGTAVVERSSSDHMPEMLTVYYMDGKRLLLTHYCMAGNQPRMEAREFDPKTGLLRFDFLDATGLTSKDAGHMHAVTLHLTAADRITADWQFYEGGKPTMKESFEYTRVR